MLRLLKRLIILLTLAWAPPALAEVQIHFHSFNGSVLFGRYPHTFIVLEGTLDATGEAVNENYGFSARRATPAVLAGPVEHMILTETAKNIRRTNRHFSITLSDAEYVRVMKLVQSWMDAPGKFYDLENRNCIHFVGEIARLIGLKVDYPSAMLRQPKRWLNHISALNPDLGAKPIK
ncbi:MAG: hypothetical protein AAF291_15040 [Pseudomonadota bacterium]